MADTNPLSRPVIKLSWKLHCFRGAEAANPERLHRKENSMAKKSRVVGDELVLTAKAIRRGEKLERTLTKLTIVQEAGSPAEAFLKAVQKGLAQLRKED